MKEKALRKLLIKNMPEVHWQPIESGGVARGIPDLNGCWNGKEIWIELKQGRPRLSAFQKNWIRRRASAGGIVWVLTVADDTIYGWSSMETSPEGMNSFISSSFSFPSYLISTSVGDQLKELLFRDYL